MAEKITYYAIIHPSRTRENPSGLARRLGDETGWDDEAIGRTLEWHPTSLIVEWEYGQATEDLEEISEAEANELIERFRERWKTSNE